MLNLFSSLFVHNAKLQLQVSGRTAEDPSPSKETEQQQS
jgi:hypothetical protein